MIKHCYGTDPATGKPGHYTVDHGPAKAAPRRSSPIVPRGSQNMGASYGRKIHGGGGAA